MLVRGIRGAITVNKNSMTEMISATKELLLAMKESNDIDTEDIVSIFFSTTPDLNAVFPASASRELGWTDVPLFGLQEANIYGGIKKCIRILIQVNCEKKQNEINHCYLREAKRLRPDLN